jgi:hypothetical protein
MITPLSIVAALEAGTLPEPTAERLAAALAMAARDVAVRELAMLLDPTRTRAVWAVAGEISERLVRFEGTAWPRIKAGYRSPRGPMEEALAVMLNCPTCPRTQRRLVDLLN